MDTAAIAQVERDGADPKTVTADDLSELQRMVREVRLEAASQIYADRRNYDNIVFCRWDGQSADGRMWDENLGQKVKPFNGCSDNRVRLVDKLIGLRVLQMTAAVMRGTMNFMPMDGADTYAAAKWSILARWLKDNYWGNTFRNNVKLLARWQESDTPAVVGCLVDWQVEKRMEYREITAEQLVDLYIEKTQERGEQPDEARAQDIIAMAVDPLREEELKELLAQLAPSLTKQRVAGIARDLVMTGKAEMPLAYAYKEGPEIRPLRIYDDVFIPANTTDPDKARIVFLRYWKTEAEIREMAATNDWDGEFVAELLGDDGSMRGAVPGASEQRLRGYEGRSIFEDANWEDRVVRFNAESNRRKGLWEILVALYPATNADGVLGFYTTTFSWYCKKTATPRMPFKRKHGGLPIVWFQREQLTQRFLDSRGVPELACTDQSSFKLLRDSFEDHTQIATLPPIKKPSNRPHYTIDYEPMGSIESDPRNPTEFMTPPQYPQSADRYWEKVRRDIAETWGLPHNEADPTLGAIITQDYVDQFLGNMARVFKMAIQLCQEKMPDATLARILGGRRMEISRSRKEIQGNFDMSIKLDMRDLNMETLLQKAKIVLEGVRPLDSRAQVQYSKIAERIVASVDPTWADEAVVPAEAADIAEAADERAALVAMLSGIRPEMPDGGINAKLRLEILQGEIQPRQTNPDAFPPISRAAALLIEERIKYLEFQATQMENAEIGRVGVDTKKTNIELASMSGAPGPESGVQK